jgi:hypothetical protein
MGPRMLANSSSSVRPSAPRDLRGATGGQQRADRRTGDEELATTVLTVVAIPGRWDSYPLHIRQTYRLT